MSTTKKRVRSKAKTSSLKSSHPRVWSCLVCLGFVVVYWWARSFYAMWTTTEVYLGAGVSPSSSLSATVGKETRCRVKLASSDTSNDGAAMAVVMDSLLDDKLLSIGGTGHWFHLIERILPYIVPAAKKVWRAGAQLRSKKIISMDKDQISVPSKLYLIFQEEAGVSTLDPFSRFLLSSVISGGYYDEVIIGHSSDIDDGLLRGSAGDGIIRQFRKHATLFFPNAERQDDVTYTEVVYDGKWRARGLRADLGAARGRYGEGKGIDGVGEVQEDHHNIRDVSALCVEAIMRISWDNAPPKRYFLMGNNTEVYTLLHASVENICRLEPLAGADTTSMAARYMGASRSSKAFGASFLFQKKEKKKKKKKKTGVRGTDDIEEETDAVEDDDLTLSALETGKSLETIEQERIRRATLPRDDLSRLPMEVTMRIDMASFSTGRGGVEYSLPREGRSISATGDDARNEAFSRKVAKWAAALEDRGAVGALAAGYNYNMHQDVLRSSYEHAGDVLKLHENLILAKTQQGGLPAAPVATDVPLRVLIYNRDRSRRLQNAEAAAELLRRKLELGDEERHSHLPLTYKVGERHPRKGPALQLGSLKEDKPIEEGEVEEAGQGRGQRRQGGMGRGRAAYRRKRGGFARDQSSLRHYDDGHGKVAWTVELMVHNGHRDTHNPHTHTSHLFSNHTSAAASGDASSAGHLPVCQVVRALREATILVTPHGFQSILTLLQPLKSLLVEVFPYGYNKPEIYGLIQAGMRAFDYGKHRSYLHTESPPTAILPRLMHSLRILDDPFINGVSAHALHSDNDTKAMLQASLWDLPPHQRNNDTAINLAVNRLRSFEEKVHRDEHTHDPRRRYLFEHPTCTANSLCRHIVRNQDVMMTEPFIRRVVEYAKTHYVSNKEKNAYTPADVM